MFAPCHVSSFPTVVFAPSHRGAWEVERVICACTWPEEVLRVPRKCGDAALLKQQYKRVSMAVHPDKCSAGAWVGGSARACAACGLVPALPQLKNHWQARHAHLIARARPPAHPALQWELQMP